MKRLLPIILLMLLASPLHAGLKFNPKLGYNLLKFDNTSSKQDMNGAGFGVGVGYSFVGFYSMLEYETIPVSSDNTSVDGESLNNIGIVLGYEFPILLNVWLNYVVNSEINNIKGSGTKIGFGYSIAPMIQLYVEIFDLKYDELGGVSLSNNFKVTGQQVGIQIPL